MKAARDAHRRQEQGSPHRPRAVLLGKSVAEPDPQPFLRAKYRMLAEHLDVVLLQLGRGRRRDMEGVTVLPLPVFGPKPLPSLLYYLLAPLLALREASRRRPSAILCQSPLEAAPLLLARMLLPPRHRPPVVVEVHGDWRTATRLYGSPRRRLLAPLVDRLAVVALARADRVRAVGSHTAQLAREAGHRGELVVYPAWSDYEEVTRRPPVPLPFRPVVAFVGALEPTKGVDVLLEAWPQVAAELPDARLVLVGDGSQREQVAQAVAEGEVAGSVTMTGRVPRREVAGLLDAATLLVLPSRSEGLALVLLEAMARGRAVVSTTAGGTAELVEDGVTGLLVPPDDVAALAEALLRVLQEPAVAAEMGHIGHERFLARDPAAAHEQGVRDLADWIRGHASAG